MKQKVLKLMCLLCVSVISMSAWADDVKISIGTNPSGSEASTYLGEAQSFTIDGVSFKMNNYNPSSGQIRGNQTGTANNFQLYNTTAIPGTLKSITITVSTAASTFVDSKVYINTSNSAISEASSTGTNPTSAEWSGLSGTYFYISMIKGGTSGTCKISGIEIVYTESSGGGDVAATPSISGMTSFLSSTEVSITCATDGALIHYTTDGSTPTSSSATYSDPFEISATTTVKAIAVKDGLDDSDVASSTFTKVTPKTVAEAIDYIDAGENLTGQYVAGKVSQIDSYSSNQITYWISDDGTTTDQMEVYRGKNLNNTNFSSITDLALGDDVVVYGTLQYYSAQSVYEFGSGNYLVSHSYPATTVQTNDADMGSAVLTNRTTITATPNSGYRVMAGTAGYTVVSGTATVTNNGDNTFTISASTDCTVTINFEAIPTYTIACVADPVAGGSVAADDASLIEGATTTLTATPDAGYEFTGWTVKGTGASLSSTSTNPTTLTMGSANVTVTATFATATTYEINWSVNGVIVKTENVVEDDDITFAAPASGIPSGYTFMGWVVEANKINMPTDTDPSANYVTSATSTADITYYAVLARNNGTSWVETALTSLTSSDIFVISNGSYALNNDGGTSSAPSANEITVFGTQITSEVEDKLKWQLSGNTTDGYTFYPNGDNEKWLYCNTTAASSSNNNIRVGTGDRKVWKEDASGYLVTNDTYTARYLSLYNDQDFRGYINTTSSFVPVFYKSVTTYVGYCTQTTYTRSTAAGNWGTICLPYDATVAGAKLYTIVGKEITGSEVTALLLDEVASMEAGKPYIFMATASDVVATYTGTTYTAAGAENGLYGTYSAIAAGEWDTYVPGNLYLLTTSNVQAANKATSSLAANRAYIVLDEVNNIGSPVKGVRLGFDGTEIPTGINGLTPALSEGEGVIYNLQGQRMNGLQRGINIVGGKKVLVK